MVAANLPIPFPRSLHIQCNVVNRPLFQQAGDNLWVTAASVKFHNVSQFFDLFDELIKIPMDRRFATTDYYPFQQTTPFLQELHGLGNGGTSRTTCNMCIRSSTFLSLSGESAGRVATGMGASNSAGIGFVNGAAGRIAHQGDAVVTIEAIVGTAGGEQDAGDLTREVEQSRSDHPRQLHKAALSTT